MLPNPSGPGPIAGAPRSFSTAVLLAAVVVVVALGAIAVGWIALSGTPVRLPPPVQLPPPVGIPVGPTPTYYGSPLAFSNLTCVENCNGTIVRANASAVYIIFNVTSLTVPRFSFRLTVTNLGTSPWAAFHFFVYGGEWTGIIFEPTYLNTSGIDNTWVGPLAPSPAAGSSATVTLSLTPKNATDFTPTRAEFFWLGLSCFGQTPWYAATSIQF